MICGGYRWFRTKRTDIFTALSLVAEANCHIQFLLFCETDVASPDLVGANLGKTTLAQNMLFYPYYSREDIALFIHDVARFFGSDISPETVNRISDALGCHTWLVKEAVRIYLHEEKLPDNFLSCPSIRVRLETIWQMLTPPEQSVCLKLVSSNTILTPLEENAKHHLLRMHFLIGQDSNISFGIPILAMFLSEKQHTKTISVTSEGRIICEGIVVDHYFGKNEIKALACLIGNSAKVVERATIASAIWKTEDNYSDWALDRIMSRLRDKLRKLGVSPDRLRVVKKIGYMYE